MPTQVELDSTYMGTALLHAKMSKATRAKVGACLVTSTGVIIPGYNGMPAGLSNECENTHWDANHGEYTVTKPEVIHAELNCILKAAREGISCIGATVYVTLSPCIQCSAMLVQAGVSRLVYDNVYRDTNGLDLLVNAGIKVEYFQHR